MIGSEHILGTGTLLFLTRVGVDVGMDAGRVLTALHVSYPRTDCSSHILNLHQSNSAALSLRASSL